MGTESLSPRASPRRGLFRIFSSLNNTPHPTQQIHWKSTSVQRSISLTHRETGHRWISLQQTSALESVDYLSAQDAWAWLGLRCVTEPEAAEPGCCAPPGGLARSAVERPALPQSSWAQQRESSRQRARGPGCGPPEERT